MSHAPHLAHSPDAYPRIGSHSARTMALPPHGAPYARQDYYHYDHVHPYPPAAQSPTYGDQGDLQYPAGCGNAEEREQKRRVAHSAMERRRRERTNQVIDTLKGMVPWLRDEARMQKLEVLEQCVCYIKELQQSAEAVGAPPLPTKRRRGQSWPDSDGGRTDEPSGPADVDAAGPSSPASRRTRCRTGSPAAPAAADVDARSLSRAAPPGTPGRPGSTRPPALYTAAPATPDLASDSSAPSTASSTMSVVDRLHTPLPPIKTAIGFLML
ncbi:hypothetical protein H4R19_000682 [Coemansia spiralis]|nr:hypothetical protein H4R19_000682 [Coemansia spiralis]